MDKNYLKSLHKSFQILEERKSKLLEDEKDEIGDLKQKVKIIREHSTQNLQKLIKRAKYEFESNGIECIYAEDEQKALLEIFKIIKDEKIVAKSKSNTINEIGLSKFLDDNNIELVETDLGDRIIQIDSESKGPSHPIAPAAHLNINQIAEITSKKFKKEIKAEPQVILEAVKEDVVKRISNCSIGITGANSIAANDGAFLMVHNEGNITLLTMKDIHIVVAGIDKLVQTIEDAVSVVKLETIFATGKKVPSYMNVISAPSKTADIEQILLKDMYGAKRVIVILLDNGRSKLLEEYSECLLCIGCGSCIVKCPVYNVTGYEFGYKSYLGGRGISFSRFITDERTCFDSGLFKCTSCGQCTLDCPLNIKTNEMIEKLRAEFVKKDIYPLKHAKTAENIKKNGSPF